MQPGSGRTSSPPAQAREGLSLSGLPAIIISIYYILKLLYTIFLAKTNESTPLDEITCAIVAPFAVLCLQRATRRDKHVALSFVVYAAIGLLGAMKTHNLGIPQPKAAFYDIFLDAKYFIMFFGLSAMFRGSRPTVKPLAQITYLFAAITCLNFPFLMFDFIRRAPVGIYGQPLQFRMGFFQAQGLMRHQFDSAIFALFAVLGCLYLVFKRYTIERIFLLVVCWISLIVTISTKENITVFICLFFAAIFMQGRETKFPAALRFPIVAAGAAGLYLFTPAGTLLNNQLGFYLVDSGEVAARTVLSKQSYAIAQDHFPIGTGAGSYASTPSFRMGYSDVYYEYGLSHIYGASPKTGNFLTDIYWPKIIGQTGVAGVVVLLYCFMMLWWPSLTTFFARRNPESWLIFSYALSGIVISTSATPFSSENVYVALAFMLAYASAYVAWARTGAVNRPAR